MGVDSYIFDEVSKECYYFDRKWNIFTAPTDPRALEILAKLDVDGSRATSEEVVYVCEHNIKFGEGKPGWNASVLQFALARPNGRFFSRSDHDREWSGEVIEEQGYKVIPEETY